MTARVTAGYRYARAAARALGVKSATYAAHENGSRGFGIDHARRYAEFYNVSPAWILTGESFDGKTSAPPPKSDLNESPLSDNDILNFGKEVLKLMPQNVPQQMPELPPDSTAVPQFIVHRMTGKDTDLEADVIEQWGFIAQWHLPSNYITETLKVAPGDVAILAVVDDNMAPTYKKGDLLLLDALQKKFTVDGVYFFLTEIENIHIQNIEHTDTQFILSNDNPEKSTQHPERTLDKDAVDIQGRVCGIIAAR